MESSGQQQQQQHAPHDSGHSLDSKELEHEVQALREKDVGAAVRLADYEDEIRRLKRQIRKQVSVDVPHPDTASNQQQPTAPTLSRWGSVLQARRPTPPTQNQSPSSRERELETALATERTARLTAEQKVQQLQTETEELSESLFTEANKMVAEERRKNAKLEERIRVLEARERDSGKAGERVRVLEQRERDRKSRLERLEAAVAGIERARGLLGVQR